MEFVALQSVVCDQVRESPGFFPLRLWLSPFPARLCGLPPVAVPRCFRSGFILSCASRLLQSPSSLHPPFAFRLRAPPMGSRPSSRHQLAASTSRERPKLASFRPRRFARPRRLPPPPALRVCFTPQPRPGFALQGLCRSHSRTSFRSPLPSCRFRCSPASDCSPAPETNGRLQGLSPCESPLPSTVV